MVRSKSLAKTSLNTRSFSLIVATSCAYFLFSLSLYNLEILKENAPLITELLDCNELIATIISGKDSC